MQLYPINAGNFKLDGGAMFGVVPKSLWTRTNPADNNNMIDIAARCLLIEDGKKLVLITIDKSLAKYGFTRDDITDVFMTHLHFDHCGGSIQYNKNRTILEPAFKNAHFWSNKKHWQWATNLIAEKKLLF